MADRQPTVVNRRRNRARTLLGAVASSTIGVVGTVFSTTIAALSLAAGRIGPRRLRNFTRDRGNQLTLGAFEAAIVNRAELRWSPSRDVP